MRISHGFSNQITKVNTTLCSEKTEIIDIYEKSHYFASKTMKTYIFTQFLFFFLGYFCYTIISELYL